MKARAPWSLVVAAGLFASSALAAVPQAGPVAPAGEPGHECACGKIDRLRAMGATWGMDEATGSPFAAREASTDTDLISVDLDIEITPSGAGVGTIAGTNTMRVRSLVNGLTQFTFRLRSQYTISSLTVNGNAVTPPGVTPTYTRLVTLDRAYNAGEEFTIAITYSGVAVNVGLGSIWFTTQNGQPIVSSLSESYYAGTWWPVKDGDFGQPGDNGDKAIGSIAITAPSALKTVSNGLLTSTTPVAGGKTKYRWTTAYPTSPYLFCFSTTNYNQWTQNYTYPLTGGGTGTMPVQFSIYPASDNAGNRAAWEKVLDMLPVFRTIYGEYPFVNEKYGIYQFPFGGGMEHQTYTGQGTFDESVTAHELGHQWWGDHVTCKTWNDIWLNEGMATYTEALWEERKAGSSGLPALHATMAARRPTAFNDSVYCYDVSNVNRIFSTNFTYRKAGWVFHQLRHVMGDATFFAALAQYRLAYGGSAATTNNFRDVCASVSGRDLTEYFADWVYGTGVPSYTYGVQNVNIAGQNYAKVVINQTQTTTYGSGSAFTTPLDVRVTTSAGTQNFVVQNSARLQHYLLPVPAAATGMSLDPDTWVLVESKASTAYTNGPAKVVTITPAPGSTLASPPASIQVRFSENVSINAGNVSLVGPGGPVAFSFAYASNVATITPTSALAGGSYTLTFSGVNTVASGMSLDGEIVGGSLPSGDGIAGGSASWSFSVTPPACPADLDDGTGTGTTDGGVDINDLLYFLAKFEAGDAAADLDDDGDPAVGTPDGGVDINDLLFFLARFEGGC